MSSDAMNNSAYDEWKPSSSLWLIAFSVMLATFMEVLDTSVANVSLPHIAGSFSAGVDESTWVLTSYLISNAIILPATAWFSVLFGRKRFLISCVIIFTLASLACGAATSLGMLVFARVIQGLGGGALQPLSQAILFESFPREKRGMSMAIFGIGVIFAPIIGPTLGGWLTDNFSWRWIFYVNIPVGILAVLMMMSFVEDPPYIKDAKVSKIDYVGFGFMAVGLAALQIILDKGQRAEWFAAPWICWLTTITVISFISFIIWELHQDHPIVNLRVLKDTNLALGTLIIALVGGVLYGTLALLPLFLQTLMRYTAELSGFSISPRGIGALFTIVIVGRLVNIIDNRFLVAVGFGLLSYSCYMLANINTEISMINIIIPNILSGVSMSMIFIPLNTLAYGTLRKEDIGAATGIFNLMRNIGGSIGISVTATLLANRAQMHQSMMISHLTPYDPVYVQRLQAFTQFFAAKSGLANAAAQAHGAIYNVLLQQSNLWGFVDNFRLYALICLLLVPLVFLFKNVSHKAGQPPAH